MKVIRVNELLTHKKGHIDEYFGVWQLKRFGEEIFPGVEEAPINYLKTGSVEPNPTKTESLLRDEGKLYVGIGGGCFDEHANAFRGRLEGCASSLIAEYLGIQDDPKLKPILEMVKRADNGDNGKYYHYPNIIKQLQLARHSDKMIMELSFIIFDAMYAAGTDIFNNKDFHALPKIMRLLEVEGKYELELVMQLVTIILDAISIARNEYLEARDIVASSMSELVDCNEQPVRIAVVQSDNFRVMAVARNMGYDILLLRQEGGNTQIFALNPNINLDEVTVVLRVAEQKMKGTTLTTNFDTLRNEGKVRGAEEWHLESSQMLLNGSINAEGVTPTQLKIEQVLTAIKIGVDSNSCPKKFASKCRQGFCDTTRKKVCSFYPYGFKRCRENRFVTLKEKEGKK